MKVGILEPKYFSTETLSYLQEFSTVQIFEGSKLEDFLSDKEALFIRLKHKIDSAFLECAPRLSFLCSPTTGLNHIDLEAVASRGISVLSLKGEAEFLADVRATPEHTLGLLLAVLRNYGRAFASTRLGVWDREIHFGHELREAKVGIIGMGRVGKLVSKYLGAIGAQVYFFDANPAVVGTCGEISCSTLHELIERTSIIVLCASFSPQSDRIIDRECIERMKGKYFVNTARGELIDEAVLLDAIEANHFAGVAIDVISDEQGKNNLGRFRELMEKTNLIVTPHIGGATFESISKTENLIAKKLYHALLASPMSLSDRQGQIETARSRSNPKLSIVTISFNCAAELERTIQSVTSQSYDDFEYIVIDGGSTDGSKEVIQRYQDKIAYWVSERDNGIYDAMLKGAKSASGTWINFMNAGDEFADNDTLSKVACLIDKDADLVYGHHFVRYENGVRRLQIAESPNHLWKRMICSHQSLFTRRRLLLSRPFDYNYKICADYEHIAYCYSKGFKFQLIECVIASISAGGVSDIRRFESIHSRYRIARVSRNQISTHFFYYMLFLDNLLRTMVKRVLPEFAIVAWLRLKAMRASRSKRGSLAEPSSQKVGKVVSIEELGNWNA